MAIGCRGRTSGRERQKACSPTPATNQGRREGRRDAREEEGREHAREDTRVSLIVKRRRYLMKSRRGAPVPSPHSSQK